MTAYQWRAVDVRSWEYAEPQVPCPACQGRGRPFSGLHFDLGQRLVRPLSYRLHVHAEDDVAHRRVADDHGLVDAAAVHARLPAHLPHLEVDGRYHDPPQLAGVLSSVIGDAVHDVAAPEPLRVLEGCRVDDRTPLQVDHVHRHGRCTDVHRQPVDAAPVGFQALASEVDAVPAPYRQGGGIDLAAHGAGQCPGLAPQHRELYLGVYVRDGSLAGESVAPSQE